MLELKYITFGGFVRDKRIENNITLRKLAGELDIVPAYMSDIENGHRYPPAKDKIEKIAEVLHLSQEETNLLFDLAAGNKKNAVSPDLADYIMSSEKCRQALRLARDVNAGDKMWDKIISLLESQKR